MRCRRCNDQLFAHERGLCAICKDQEESDVPVIIALVGLLFVFLAGFLVSP